MAKFEKRLEARKLRRGGWSINVIAKHLGVSKASASVWCRDVELTLKQKELLLHKNYAGRMKGAAANKRKKEERILFHKENGRTIMGKLTERELLIAGVTLYWGEGNKKSKIGLTNSDPTLIKFAQRWFRAALGVRQEDFMPRLFINNIHKKRVKLVLQFWSNLLQLPLEQFGKPVLLKKNPKKVYENYDNYFGVLALHVKRGTDLKYKILGLIDALKN